MNKLYFIVLLFSFCEKLIATNPPDAISLSLGGSAAAYSSPFCIQYNAANLVYSPSNIAFNAQNRYGIRDYTKILFVGNYSLKESSLGFSYQAENGIIFNQKISAAIAKKIQPNLACGITLNLNRFSSRDSYYQNTQIITFSAGLSYQINPKNHLGFQIENPNQSEIIAFPKEKSIELRNRIETTLIKSNQPTTRGSLIYQDLILKPKNKAYQWSTRIALSRVEDYKNRIYSFEKSPLYDYPMFNHSYSGIRYYILFRYTTLSNTQLWFKYGYTQHDTPIESFDEQYAIGSGLNEVAGNKKYTFTLQLKHVFN